jgi:hypothetical protein
MKQESNKKSEPTPDVVDEIKTQLGYLLTSDFTTDCWIRIDGRMNSAKLAELAGKLLALLEADYPAPKQPAHCLCCGHELRERHE